MRHTSLLVVGLLAATLASESAAEQRPTAIGASACPKAQPAPAPSEKLKEEVPKNKAKGKFTISKETTYVTEPVDKDGYIDYATALNRRLRQGVTPENNACVLLWKAVGPHPGKVAMSTEFFQWMEMKAPPEKGQYFIDENQYMKEHDEVPEIYNQFYRSVRPWTPKGFPQVASWLEVNEKPLALAVEASKRTHYFSPFVPGSGPKTALFRHEMSKLRGIASAFIHRAMLRIGQGNYDDAWQDLLACHRLGRLIGRGRTLVDVLVAIAIDGSADMAELAFLAHAKLDAKQIESCLADLRSLPPLVKFADKIDIGMRFEFLEMVMLTDCYGIQVLKNTGLPTENLFDNFVVKDINWDPGLRFANRWYDRVVAVAREKDRGLREKEWDEIEAEAKKLKEKLHSGELAKKLAGGTGHAEERGNAIVDFWISSVVPPMHFVQKNVDQITQLQENLHVAFALARFQREHGRYPKTLDELAPKYLARIPQDLFSGKPLIYRPSEKGFLLYSVGKNGKDDGGHGPTGDPPGDDIVLRIPLPELP